MLAERWQEIERLYHSACERRPEERRSYLESATDDEALRREVESLLANEESAAGFLETHSPELVAGNLKECIPAGTQIGPYLIIEFLRAGGMGEVYGARDTRLDRTVALKFLPYAFAANRVALDRFQREARAASALNHPRICTIHDTGQHQNRPYLVMELLSGQSLRERVAAGPVGIPEIVDFALQICDALQAAHATGIVHRDIKPANVFLTSRGDIKILDFGLAKFGSDCAVQAVAPETGETVTANSLTKPGNIMGTVAYLSPEQARGEEVDARTDLYSFGVMLYEVATGRPAFQGKTSAELVGSILHTESVRPSELNPRIPAALERIILRALQKDRRARYQSAAEMAADLKALAAADRRKLFRVMAVSLAVLLIGGSITAWWGLRVSRVRWARNEAVPRARLLAESGSTPAALALLRQAERWLPRDSEIEKIRRVYAMTTIIQTSPPGASVYFKDYMEVNAPWQYLDKSPLEMWIANGQGYRLKLEKPGFQTIEAALPFQNHWSATLAPQAGSPPGMVIAVGGPVSELNGLVLPDYWLDKYEVTNRQFKEFVDAGGYQSRRFWKQDFVKDGRTLSFEGAMAEFRDATGRAGPSTWQFGTYPAGEEDFPVGGVSWYEAAAYAEFAGKSLPTVHHWRRASDAGAPYAFMEKLSSFDRQGPARVGSYPGVSPVGAYDLAGNVREWCWNSVKGRRYVLGGD